ncbi:MAG: PH domain-containing protein [Clostridia bacterium]|nr:PH domain-containing protein [Clostridia bacterium]
MSYIQNNLKKDEKIILEGKLHGAMLIPHILLMFIFVGLFTIVPAIIKMKTTELTITNKRLVGKLGLIKTTELDTPLNKINNVNVSSGFWGKIFGYGTIKVNSSSGIYEFSGIKNADLFRSTLMNQIDKFDDDRIKKQAQEMAKAMKA